MVRLFNVYYPVRGLVLLVGEVFIICASFLIAALIRFGNTSYWFLNNGNGFYKILAVTGLVVACLHYFDLYNLQRLRSRTETYFRLLTVLGIVSLVLASIAYMFPRMARHNGVSLLGLFILTLGLCAWRSAFSSVLSGPYLRQRVYVLGAGERANRLVESLRDRKDLGMEVVGWAGAIQNGSLTRDALGRTLLALKERDAVDLVIVAMGDRRGMMPVPELLDLRLSGIKVADATALLEQISGRIEVEDLYPSWLIFSAGFRLNSATFMAARRLISIVVSLVGLLLSLPLLPLIFLAIKFGSPGPVLYRQKRVGRNGVLFNCYKFRTMRPDAEADTGPTWAGDEDPRITRVGRFLRRTRLDEIPQLWNVLRGDMGFVGPRPERPEFVEWLSREIPYYYLRHIIRPGITGWAQVRYKYGNTVEDAKEKLQYDLFYMKNLSLMLDLLIVFETVKTVLWGGGSR